MRLRFISASVVAFSGFLISSPALALENLAMTRATKSDSAIRQSQSENSSKSFVKVLSDHPGSATALTARQKNEIKQIVERYEGNQNFICTAASLAGQRQSMYPVVLRRAQLVCEYAKSLNPSLTITVQERTTTARQFNGRVVVVSK
jgi:hypothetical protein